MLVIDLILFGPIGLSIWAVQMVWIPITAAGIINGIGHYWGYRNFACEDASTNVFPWGILIGGEELHNNHHAYGTSAKLSSRWYEIDIGWFYIRTLETLGLAKVKKMAPKVKFNSGKAVCDFDTLQAIITHRYDVMTKYTRSMKSMCADEIGRLKNNVPALNDSSTLKAVKHWLHLDASELEAQDKAKLSEVLEKSKTLATIYAMRQELAGLWARSSSSKEQLVQQLQDWCQRAEASGIDSLQQFSRKLRCYA